MNRSERRAIEKRRKQELERARRQAAREPQDAAGHRSYGDRFAQTGNFEDAQRHYEKAIGLGGGDKQLFNNYAYVLSHLNRHEEALAAYQRAADVDPRDPTILTNMGVLYRLLERDEEALACYQRALAMNHNHLETYLSAGELLDRLGRAGEAHHHFYRCIEIYRDSASTISSNPDRLTVVGKAFLRLDNPSDALTVLQAALSLNSTHLPALFTLGRVQERLARKQEAMSLYRKILSLQPDHKRALKRLADLLALEKDMAGAANTYHKLLKLDPANVEARYFLSSVTQHDVPAAAPKSYVRDLFDDYADRFDSHLVGDLQYRGPEIMYAAMRGLLPGEASWRIADLGCGTGLCGPLFRGSASHLTGVDLSGRMIEKARQRQVYDDLIVGDMLDFLSARPQSFDCALAADVLIYFGDLEPVFRACHAALRDHGLLAFTTETMAGEGNYRLTDTGRYVHTVRFLTDLAGKTGFEIVVQNSIVLRQQSGVPVDAMLSILRKA